MLRNTLRMIHQQDQWFNQVRREAASRQALRYQLYQALEQVERLLEADIMEVPPDAQPSLRSAVAAVDPALGARIDRCAPNALDIQDVIFEAQDKLVKQHRT